MLTTLFMLSALALFALAIFVLLKSSPAVIIAAMLCVAPWTYPFENVQLSSVGGFSLPLRFLFYSGATALLLANSLDALKRPRLLPLPVVLLAAFVVFCVVGSVVNGASAREWLPPTVRYLLYLGMLISGMLLAARRPRTDGFPRVLTWIVVFSVPATLLALAQLVLGDTVNINNVQRVTGPYLTRPLGLSLYMTALALALLYLMIIRVPLRVPRSWVAIYLAAAGFAVVLTHARIMAGALMIGAVTLIAALPRPQSGRKWSTVILPAIAALGVVIVGYLLVPGAKERLMAVTELDSSMRLRLFIHAAAIAYFTQSPILGHGIGSFRLYFERLTGQSDVAPHDDLLGITVESGILGLGLWLAFWFAMVWALWRVRPATNNAHSFRQLRALWLAITVAGLGIGGFENALWYYESAAVSFLLGGYLLGCTVRDRSQVPAAESLVDG